MAGQSNQVFVDAVMSKIEGKVSTNSLKKKVATKVKVPYKIITSEEKPNIKDCIIHTTNINVNARRKRGKG